MNSLLDLDAAKRERANEPIIVRWDNADLSVPGELPADVFDPFLASDFDVLAILKALLDKNSDEDTSEDFTDRLLSILENDPKLGSKLYAAIKDAYRLLLGAENYAAFVAGKPSLQDYVALTMGLLAKYGVSLGEAFASPDSSENGGATPKPTSPTPTTDSTPDSSGDDQETPPAS